jgi:hypothetical protein
MIPARFLPWLFLSMTALLPNSVSAMAIASSNITFSNLTLAPAAGALTVDQWFLDPFASANNSRGQIDQQEDFALSPETLSQTATVAWATANGNLSASGDPPNLAVRGGASSSVSIPGCQPAAAFSTGLGTLSNTFTIGGTGTVAVQFGIDIAGTLNAMTDACGAAAATETVFTLEVDGNSVLSFDRSLSIGPLQAASPPDFTTHLANTIMLDAGVSHFVILEADAESSGHTIPEPSPNTLLLAGLGALFFGWRGERMSQRPRASECGGRLGVCRRTRLMLLRQA